MRPGVSGAGVGGLRGGNGTTSPPGSRPVSSGSGVVDMMGVPPGDGGRGAALAWRSWPRPGRFFCGSGRRRFGQGGGAAGEVAADGAVGDAEPGGDVRRGHVRVPVPQPGDRGRGVRPGCPPPCPRGVRAGVRVRVRCRVRAVPAARTRRARSSARPGAARARRGGSAGRRRPPRRPGSAARRSVPAAPRRGHGGPPGSGRAWPAARRRGRRAAGPARQRPRSNAGADWRASHSHARPVRTG